MAKQRASSILVHSNPKLALVIGDAPSSRPPADIRCCPAMYSGTAFVQYTVHTGVPGPVRSTSISTRTSAPLPPAPEAGASPLLESPEVHGEVVAARRSTKPLLGRRERPQRARMQTGVAEQHRA